MPTIATSMTSEWELVSLAELAALHRLCFYEFHRKFRTLLLVNDLPGSSPAGPSNNTRNDSSPVDSAGAASVTNTESYFRRSKIRTRSMSSKESWIHEDISRTYKNLQYQLQDERRRADDAERKLVEVTARMSRPSMKLGLLRCKMLHKPKRISGKGRTLKRILFCVLIYFILLHRLYEVQLDRAQKDIPSAGNYHHC